MTAGGVFKSNKGDIIIVLHHAAHVPAGKTILSSPIAENYGNMINNRSRKVYEEGQNIEMLDGYTISLNFINGLPYMSIQPFTNREWNTSDHIVLTSDTEWNPCVLDGGGDHDKLEATLLHMHKNGSYSESNDNILDNMNLNKLLSTYISNLNESQSSLRDYDASRQHFLKVLTDVIRKTIGSAMQYAQSSWIIENIRNTIKSPFSALNMHRRHESVATDTIFSDTPAIDDGATCAQLFIGLTSKYCEAIGMKIDGELVSALMDTIRKNGAMDRIVTDGGEALISKKVFNILRHLCIKNWHNEPYYQHQNPAERRYNDVKRNLHRVLNSSRAPASYWLLCLNYVIYIMNRMALESLQWCKLAILLIAVSYIVLNFMTKYTLNATNRG